MSSSSTTATKNPQPQPPKQVINFANQKVALKLNEENYLVWKFQILTAIEGHVLKNFIEEDDEPPNSINGNTENQEYLMQDKQLSSWLMSTITEAIVSEITTCKTSKDIWSNLEYTYTSQNLTKVMQHKSQMQNLKKEGTTMQNYLVKLKSYADALGSVGDKISEQEMILAALEGLGTEHEFFVSVITSKTERQSFKEVSTLLLSHESRIERKLKSNESTLPSVNLTMHRNENGGINSNAKLFNSGVRGNGSQGNQYQNQYRGRGGGNRNSRGGYNRQNIGNRPQCQLCSTHSITNVT